MLPTFELLDLQATADELRYRLHARADLCTLFGFLYGGSGIAASIDAVERATGRALQWITTQFIGIPTPGDDIELEVVLAKHGNVTTQAQVFASVAGDPVFASLCALTARDGGDHAQFATMPDVPPPAECNEMAEPFAAQLHGTFFDHLDRRIASGRIGQDAIDNPQTDIALWCRIPGAEIDSAAAQAFVADIVPLAVCAALGVMPGGTSLDNTLRVLDTTPSEWVLLELIADGFHRSIGHGAVRLWHPDGHLIGIAQQTCIIRTSHHDRLISAGQE